MKMAKMVTGADILRILQHDRHSTTGIDEVHFTRVARQMGFSAHARELFHSLPHNDDGSINTIAMADEIRAPRKQASDTMREFIAAMAWNNTKDATSVDTEGWCFDGTGPESARESLNVLLAQHDGVRLSELFEVLDSSDDNTLTEAEVRTLHLQSRGFAWLADGCCVAVVLTRVR